MKTITITEQQEHFLKCDCNLREYILNFTVTYKDFKEDYGYSKKDAEKAINDLYDKLK